MMERQISPNPPEAFSKRLATENKLAKYTSLENMENLGYIWKPKIWTYYGGNFLKRILFKKKKISSVIVPTSMIQLQLTALPT